MVTTHTLSQSEIHTQKAKYGKYSSTMQELGGRSSGLSGCWGEEAPTQNNQLAAVETERTRRRGGRRMLVFNREDKERLDFLCKHKGRLGEDRQTRSWKGILVSRLSRRRGRWSRHRPMRRPFPLIRFFSLFLCCGQDRWQARTIFCGPLVLIVQCSYGICIQDKVEF